MQKCELVLVLFVGRVNLYYSTLIICLLSINTYKRCYLQEGLPAALESAVVLHYTACIRTSDIESESLHLVTV